MDQPGKYEGDTPMSETTPNRTLSNRWMLILGGAGIFLVGLLVGMLTSGGSLFAFAATSSASHATTQRVAVQATKTPIISPADAAKYCTLYEQKLADELKVST